MSEQPDGALWEKQGERHMRRNADEAVAAERARILEAIERERTRLILEIDQLSRHVSTKKDTRHRTVLRHRLWALDALKREITEPTPHAPPEDDAHA